MIEKHMTLKRSDGGPDAAFSLEPHELKALVDGVRRTEVIMGAAQHGPGAKEGENIVFRKSLFVAQAVKKGELFTAQNIRSVRPGNGLAPRYYHAVLGKKAAQDIAFATPLSWDLVEGGESK